MNLWVKRTGQLLAATLLLMSCEDDSFLLGFRDQVSKFEVKFQDFSITKGSVISIDGIITDNNSSFKRLLIGEDIDPIIGDHTTMSFSEFFGDGLKLAEKVDHDYIYDSVVVQLHLDYYSYGLTGNALGKYKIHRIIEPITYAKDETYIFPGVDKELLVKVPNRYYTGSTIQYMSEELGETQFKQLYRFKNKDLGVTTNVTLTKLKNARDTLIASAKLSDAFGEELFNIVLTNSGDQFSDKEKFRALFKGLAFIPEGTNAILGFNPGSQYSRVRLYYHSELAGVVKDTLVKNFGLSGGSFNTISAVRNSDLPQVTPAYSGVQILPNENKWCVVQAGNAMVTKIDLSKFYDEFASIMDDRNIVINSAELVIEGINESDEYTPLPLLELRLMQENDSSLNYSEISEQVRDSLRRFYILTDTKHYFIGSDQSSVAANLIYNSSKKTYNASITLFIQNLLTNKNSDYKIRYVGLYPAITLGSNAVPAIGKVLDRTAFRLENIKLRVYYTQANKSNL
jgi:hypothetical protein